MRERFMQMSDYELLHVLDSIGEYTEEAAKIILEEKSRREKEGVDFSDREKIINPPQDKTIYEVENTEETRVSLWNDEYGFKVNRSLEYLAMALMAIGILSAVGGIILGIAHMRDELSTFVILGGVVLGISCFVGAFTLRWCAALGNNVAKIRQQGEKARDGND